MNTIFNNYFSGSSCQEFINKIVLKGLLLTGRKKCKTCNVVFKHDWLDGTCESCDVLEIENFEKEASRIAREKAAYIESLGLPSGEPVCGNCMFLAIHGRLNEATCDFSDEIFKRDIDHAMCLGIPYNTCAVCSGSFVYEKDML